MYSVYIRKMPVPSQEYDSCYPFVWCVCLIAFCSVKFLIKYKDNAYN